VGSGHSEAPVDEAIDRDPHLLPRGFECFSTSAALPLSEQTLSNVVGRHGDTGQPRGPGLVRPTRLRSPELTGQGDASA
jgi:hypothetical protein